MAGRPYARLSDEQLDALFDQRTRDMSDNEAAQLAHDATKPRHGVDLAWSHMSLVIAREGAAISEDRLAVSVERSLRQDGTWHQEA